MWDFSCLSVLVDIAKIMHWPFFAHQCLLVFEHLMCVAQDSTSSSSVAQRCQKVRQPRLKCSNPRGESSKHRAKLRVLSMNLKT